MHEAQHDIRMFLLEAAQSLGTQTLTEAAEILKSDNMVNMLHSGETPVKRVGEATEWLGRALLIHPKPNELKREAIDEVAFQA